MAKALSLIECSPSDKDSVHLKLLETLQQNPLESIYEEDDWNMSINIVW